MSKPKIADSIELFDLASLLYADFRKLAEGSVRLVEDHEKYRRHESVLNYVQLGAEQKARLARRVDEEIRTGKLNASERENRLTDIEDGELRATQEGYRMTLGSQVIAPVKTRPANEALQALMETNEPSQLQLICSEAFVMVKREVAPGEFRSMMMLNWPLSPGSPLVFYLTEHAAEFIAAKQDPRYPRSRGRPTTQLKQFWFLSRALAGAAFGIRTRTAINLVGSMRPEQLFEQSRRGKPTRRRKQ